MTAIFRQVEDLPVGEPGQLCCKLVPLAQRGRNGHCKTIFQHARNFAFEPAEVIHIGNHPFTRLACDRRDQSHAAGRHIDDLARKFAPVSQHVATEKIYLHALMAPAFLGERQ
jgi:hypothetical protein